MRPLVSIVIPVYNDQAGIERCLAALADQTWAHDSIEVIVVDNGSKPPIKWHAVNLSARFVSCPTPGSYAARNAGIAEARGDILAFTDADCVPDTNWVSAGVNALEQCNWRCIVGGEVVLMESPSPTAVERYQLMVGFLQSENIHFRRFSATANLFATRELVAQVGPFNEVLLSGGDREWAWRAASAGFGIQYSPEAIVRTSPRTSLAGAIRQARRVTGGFHAMRRSGWEHVPSNGLREHQSPISMAKRILRQDGLSVWARGKVLIVASILKFVKIFENLRLLWGARPERR